MPQPAALPVWASDPDALIETPTTAKQEQGWTTNTNTPEGVGEKPPLQYFNWYQNLVYQWLDWFNQVIGSITSLGTIASQNANAVAISGGNINNTIIGGTTPAAGTFSTLNSPNATLGGGSINNTPIGNTTPSTGVFTNINPLLPKAFAFVEWDGSNYSIPSGAQYNITSITRNSAGKVTVTFSSALASADYAVATNANSPSPLTSNYSAPTTTSVDVGLLDVDGTYLDSDFSLFIFLNS